MCHLTLPANSVHNDGFWSSMASNLWSLREENLYTDLEIECDGNKIISAHKIILAASVEYFRQMFNPTNRMMEAVAKKVRLNGVSYEAMLEMLNFVYTGSINLDYDNIWNVARVADFLLFDPVKRICQDFILSNISLDNCFLAKRFAYETFDTELNEAVDDFVLKNFDKLYDNEDIGIYETDEFITMLRKDELCVKNELQVFEAIINWIEYDCDERIEQLPLLLCNCVRFIFLSPIELKNISQHGCVAGSSNALKLVAEVQRHFNNETTLFDYSHKTLQQAIQTNTRPDDCRFLPLNRFSSSGALICLGGRAENSDPIDFVETYNPHTNRWECQMELQFAGRQVGITVIDTNVYILGGYNKRGQTLAPGVLNSKTGHYENIPQMPLVRRGCSVTQYSDNFIFTLGGTDSDKFSAFADVQVFDVEKNNWNFVKPMITGRRNLSAVTLDAHIYAIGGCYGEEESLCLNTVERYDINKNEWLSLENMKVGRYSCGSAVLGNRIYVVGGFGLDANKNESAPLAHCEYFDTKTQTWHEMANLQTPRGAASVVALGGRLYTIGGFNGQYLSSVECYDPIANCWTYCEPLQRPRSGCGIGCINVPAEELFI